MNTKLKTKQCRICKTEFIQYNSTQVVCGIKCATKLAVRKRIAKEKKELQEFRKKDKTIPQLIKEAQASVNAYVRERDKNKPCVSCGTQTVRTFKGYRGSCGWDAGHYRSRGAAGHLRFNLLNIWKQCSRCNLELSGNVVEYRKELINRIGEKRVIELENDNSLRSFDRDYLERVKKIFNKRKRHLVKLRGR